MRYKVNTGDAITYKDKNDKVIFEYLNVGDGIVTLTTLQPKFPMYVGPKLTENEMQHL